MATAYMTPQDVAIPYPDHSLIAAVMSPDHSLITAVMSPDHSLILTDLKHFFKKKQVCILHEVMVFRLLLSAFRSVPYNLQHHYRSRQASLPPGKTCGSEGCQEEMTPPLTCIMVTVGSIFGGRGKCISYLLLSPTLKKGKRSS